MSPEQAVAAGDFDERTDVYGLAAVIFEMLVGEVPRIWPTEDEVRSGHFTEAPAAHRSRLARVGATVEGALVRGLAVRPSQRTRNPETLMGELSGSAKPRRIYGADEVNAIVKRASELEVSSPTSAGAMTIGGVEALAAEVGIKPELVRSAAGALSRTPTGGSGFAPLKPPPENTLNKPKNWFPSRKLLSRNTSTPGTGMAAAIRNTTNIARTKITFLRISLMRNTFRICCHHIYPCVLMRKLTRPLFLFLLSRKRIRDTAGLEELL